MTQPGITDKATVYDPYGIRVEDGRFSYDMNKTSVDDFAKVEDIGKTFRSQTDKFKTRFDPTEIEPATAKPIYHC